MAEYLTRRIEPVKLSLIIALAIIAITLARPAFAQKMSHNSVSKAAIKYVSKDLSVDAFDDDVWKTAKRVEVGTCWSGKKAPEGRHFWARLLWSDSDLYVRFEANQAEPLVVSDMPDRTKKTMNLWDRDVVEIFVAPDRNEPRKYFEFEVAPTGEWIDVGLDTTSGKRISDWKYTSGMESAAKIEKNRVLMAIRIPWNAFGRSPKAGDVWLGNLLRCVGKDPDRGYLAWSPTMTAEPNFHVPEKFGEFEFIKNSTLPDR